MTMPRATRTDLSTLAGTWTLDTKSTSIEFHTKAVWVLPVRGTAKAIEGGGTITSDGQLSGTLVIDAASIDTKNRKRDEHLKTSDFFEVATFPTITFTATGAHPTGDSKVPIDGTLEVHGQTRPITVLADVTLDATGALVSAEIPINRSQWGLTSAPFGAGLKNRVIIRARFERV
jgi:polyisoprenoid-binding protein YceI